MDIHPPHALHSWKDFGVPQVLLLRSIPFVEEQMTRTASERYKNALE